MTSHAIIDLRSDTVTQPGPGMRRAMVEAPLGDDVFGDDPTVNDLQVCVADMFGMEAALFVPSGTMANQVAIRAHTEPGQEIICHRLSHIYQYEGGGPSALAGCSLALLDGERGMFSTEDLRRAVRPDDQHFPVSALVVIENTHNRGGGSVWDIEAIAAISDTARQLGLRTHLDGARLLNACAVTGLRPADYAAHFDSATLCFSKGLGAPVGSAIVGRTSFIARARRFRKMYGGAMRQAGVLAAAATYALDHNVDRLAEDHANARHLEDRLQRCARITVTTPETNIVYFDIAPAAGTAQEMEEHARQRGVRVIATGPQQLRAVTHLEVDQADIERAGDVLCAAAGGRRGP